MNIDTIRKMVYNTKTEEKISFISSCSNEVNLFIFGFNYNWADGFEIPKAIINSSICGLSTALMMFYAGDGYRYLTEKPLESESPEWLSFISDLYNRIINGAYKESEVAFTVPLSKIQLFKLNKTLSPEEKVFVTSIDGTDCCIDL